MVITQINQSITQAEDTAAPNREPGGGGGIWLNHAEGLVVAEREPGSGAGGVWLNHAEGLVA